MAQGRPRRRRRGLILSVASMLVAWVVASVLLAGIAMTAIVGAAAPGLLPAHRGRPVPVWTHAQLHGVLGYSVMGCGGLFLGLLLVLVPRTLALRLFGCTVVGIAAGVVFVLSELASRDDLIGADRLVSLNIAAAAFFASCCVSEAMRWRERSPRRLDGGPQSTITWRSVRPPAGRSC